MGLQLYPSCPAGDLVSGPEEEDSGERGMYAGIREDFQRMTSIMRWMTWQTAS
jgi:hypothetical protein